MNGKALRKHNLHKKTAASGLLKLKPARKDIVFNITIL